MSFIQAVITRPVEEWDLGIRMLLIGDCNTALWKQVFKHVYITKQTCLKL